MFLNRQIFMQFVRNQKGFFFFPVETYVVVGVNSCNFLRAKRGRKKGNKEERKKCVALGDGVLQRGGTDKGERT